MLMSPWEAMAKAVLLDCVEWLEKLLSRRGYEATAAAAIAAATDGLVNVLKVIYGSRNKSRSYDEVPIDVTHLANGRCSAERGCGEVVEFLVTQVSMYYQCSGSALLRAVA